MRGLLLMVTAAGLFAVMASLVKIGITTYGYPPLELVLWRSLVTVPAAAVVARGAYTVRAPGWMLARAAFGFTAMVSWFTATRLLSIGELSVLVRLQPVFVGILAPLLLGGSERVSGTVWAATLLGLGGTAVLLGPDLASVDAPRLGAAGLALFAAAASAVAHTCLRALGRTDEPRTVVLWFQVAAATAAGTLLVVSGADVHLPALAHLPLLVGIGGFALAGQLAMTAAYKADQAPRIAAASYAGPLFGFVLDAAVFTLAPSWSDLLGAAIVIGAGLLLLQSRR